METLHCRTVIVSITIRQLIRNLIILLQIVHLTITITWSHRPWNTFSNVSAIVYWNSRNVKSLKISNAVLLIEAEISRYENTIKANRPHRSRHLTLGSVIARFPDASNNAFVQCAISSSLRMLLVNSGDVVSRRNSSLWLRLCSISFEMYTSCESIRMLTLSPICFRALARDWLHLVRRASRELCVSIFNAFHALILKLSFHPYPFPIR